MLRYLTNNYDLFDEMFEGFMPKLHELDNSMKTDAYKKDGHYHLEIELAGYNKEDITTKLTDGYLVIEAKHESTDEEKNSKGELIRSERKFGSTSRSFYVGDNLKAEDVKASFNNGILNIIIPTSEQKAIETTQTISIE